MSCAKCKTLERICMVNQEGRHNATKKAETSFAEKHASSEAEKRLCQTCEL